MKMRDQRNGEAQRHFGAIWFMGTGVLHHPV